MLPVNGNFFTNTYSIKYKDRHYLIIGSMSKILDNDKLNQYVVSSQLRKVKVFNIDGIDYQGISVKARWLEAAAKSGNRVNMLAMYILQNLTEIGFKNIFPDIWIVNHNYHAIKKNRTEFQNFRYKQKRNLLEPLPDSHILHITKDMSIREAAKSYRNF